MGYLRCGKTRRLVRILLDGGSQATLLRSGLIPLTNQDVYQKHDLSLVGGKKITKKLRLLNCYIADVNGTWSCPLTVTEIDEPCGDAPVVYKEQLKQYSHLNEIDLQVAPYPTIDVLLGVDNTHLMIWEEYLRGECINEPVAVKCPFGWFIQGGQLTTSALFNYVNVSAVGPMEDFLGIETMGLEPKKSKCSEHLTNRKATEAIDQSVKQLPNGTYEIRLPWKRAPNDLPDNYGYAVKRLKSIEKQFENRSIEWEVYCEQMKDQLKRGVSRRVTEAELQRDREAGKKMWFLPHFAVTKESKTTPVRVVYDGKARFQGHSLNDYLYKGENVNTDLFDVALRFREDEVGIIANISKMFQAIKISSDDARFHRFVFRENPNHPIQVYELTTVTFGDKPSPTAAIVTLRHIVSEHAPGDKQLERIVTDQFYMDDLNESVTDANEADNLESKLIETLKKGNFNIRKWQSNVRNMCDESEDATAATALGTKWDLVNDTLKVKEVKLIQGLTPTKRSILKQTASYYDVIGMLSGVLVRPKTLLQKLWQLNIDWDTPLNQRGELCAILSEINKDLEKASDIEIPRCLIPEPFRGKRPLPKVSLHGASDASEDAMGIGVWLRWSHEESTEAYLSFVCARARLTPLKQSSIPMKELQAILLLSRLMLTVKNALRFDIVYSKIWTDSMTAISWLRGQSKSFRSYVAYRVGEITSEFDPIKDIAFVQSDQHTIDIVSRGGNIDDMKQVIDGPGFLRSPPISWPKTPTNVQVAPEDGEQKKFHVRNANTLTLKIKAIPEFERILDPTKFSSWPKLKMVTARVVSLKQLPKNQWLKKLTSQISEWPSPHALKEAELLWIRQGQAEINFNDHNIMKLDPVFDEKEGVYRVGVDGLRMHHCRMT
ncbi:uncharacterized protein [Antedon mediterranea]|uniref:uncharacterized protein n=1 Tax=Antedon mediterranea TaxID=105859 RepID=UPI003AF6DBE4